MAKEIIPHQICDWSKIDEKDGFWGRIDQSKADGNFGIHRYHHDLWTSGQVGVGRVFDRNDAPVHDNGKEHILIITSRFGLDPWKMLEAVMLDDEYESYMAELAEEKKFLFRIFCDQPLVKLPQDMDPGAEMLFALSYVNSCYSLCKKGLKKSLIYHEENLTAKLRGKIDVHKNIRHNTARGRCDRFYCRYVDFTQDTVENRVVKAALLKCRAILKGKFCEESSVKSKMNYCLNMLKHVKTAAVDHRDFHTAVGGLYSYYKPVIQQARAILTMNFQSVSLQADGSGKGSVYTIPYAINMETLFEYYARTELKKALGSGNYRVERYSRKYYLQKGVSQSEDGQKGIHLIPFCIPDIVIYDEDRPLLVIDAKYKLSGRPDRSDSHQLLAYALLTGAGRCGFILPGRKTQVREMPFSGGNYLPLAPASLRYYELLLGSDGDSGELKKALL